MHVWDIILENPILYPEDPPTDNLANISQDLQDTFLVQHADENIEKDPWSVIKSSDDSIFLWTVPWSSPELSEIQSDTSIQLQEVAPVEQISDVLPKSDSTIPSNDSLLIEDSEEVQLKRREEKDKKFYDEILEKKKSHHSKNPHKSTHTAEEIGHKKPHIKPEKKEKLVEIINNVKTLIARWQTDDARALIVWGLAIEKNNRELNLIMASLYEKEYAFSKAEFILKDIATEHPDDIEVLMHLATDLAMQRKYDISYEIYKKILTLNGESEEVLYTLTHLASEMVISSDVLYYARLYLKQFPHNPEILWLYSQWLIAEWQRKDAVETLIKLKNLTPYNQEIADLIQKLVTEEELAGNFGGEKN